ncbi:MAG: REDY-like protein HapK [Pseudomonadota bacterium]
MTTIVVLFNLKGDASREAYEAWARSTDLPTVRGLDGVDGFDAFCTTGLLGKDGQAAPYEYVEIIRIADMEKFGAECATDTMRKVAGEFQAFADGPTFMLCESLDS